MLLLATCCDMWPSRPSASPLNRSRATIMKSLSGGSISGLALDACIEGEMERFSHVYVTAEYVLIYNTAYYASMCCLFTIGVFTFQMLVFFVSAIAVMRLFTNLDSQLLACLQNWTLNMKILSLQMIINYNNSFYFK